MYISGQGVPQDYVEAMKWYRKAADREPPIREMPLASLHLAYFSVMAQA
jgi:uncharacterized protein